jgi:predicted transcriptional regulator
MKKECLIMATITVAVLILASSVPAMQTTSISEYQPICPEESYNKIMELHEEGLSEEEIAEKLELPLDIVSGFLSGNYTLISSCPEPYQKSEENVSTEKPMESITPEEPKESITPGKKNVPEKSMEQWRQDHTVKVKAIRTLKYEQGYLISKEMYTSEEYKKRFGKDMGCTLVSIHISPLHQLPFGNLL